MHTCGMTLLHADIEAIERATLAAVEPQHLRALQALGGWLVPIDDGTVGRAHSAVPLTHDLQSVSEPVSEPATAPARGQAVAAELAQLVQQVDAIYSAAGMATAWRLPELPSFDSLRGHLQRSGHVPSQPTWVQVAQVADAAGGKAQEGLRAEIQPQPSLEWQSVYLGADFDAVDAASRIGILSRGKHTHFAVLRVDGRAVASGALSLFAQPNLPRWASIHGMRCAGHVRRQGLATAIVRQLAAFAQQQGFERWFLQVEQSNLAAQAVYARLGFKNAWGYQYWRKAA
jgi:N-acetylglutamate synthase